MLQSGFVKDEDNLPIPAVKISVKDAAVLTDSTGHFAIELPLEKQQSEQRLTAYKEGYQLWDYTQPVLAGIAWTIILQKQ